MPEAESRAARRARTRKPRGRGLRTRTGCVTCRKRHLKCDERTPSCGPCIKSGHACFYGNGSAAQAHTPRQPAAATDEHPTPHSPDEVCLAAISPAVSQSNAVEPDSTLAGVAAGDSPGSTVSSSRPAIGTATAGWFGLLLDDAALELGTDDSSAFYPLDPGLFARDASSASQRLSILSPAQANSIAEHGLWQCSERIQLSTNECLLFENFVRRVSCWLDLFDPDDNFSTLVPRLAMYNTGLMNAILALSVRHISLNPSVAPDTSHERADALKYYYETLHYLHKAMQYDSFKTSLELLATSLIVSTYEMLDGSRQDWERHLKGVFWIQRSQVIHGDTGGLKQAIWWAWLCQDVWAAFREKRKVLTFWKHPRTFDQLNEHELACRAIFTFSKAVNFCSMEEVEADKDDVAGRIAKSESLINMLDEWQSLLTIRFSPLPVDTNTSDIFTPIWIQPSSFAVAVQLNHAARILIYLHRPLLGGLNEYLQQQREIARCVDTICGIAKPLIDGAASLMSSQCLYIAGLCVQDTKQREAILELIKKCRHRTGWPIKPLEDELQTLWTIH
ncbi:zn 2cys6 transcription factor [Neofusicoccum parvum]|uniref:Zn 2cys6 transcription factor n=1 Tax=Neofusicoccum parvum TaxID=310453 RepID=A0ACB5SMX5_9PEZI|nr:zn 2cys6 transcription factor [Neofusicoccum parvum]